MHRRGPAWAVRIAAGVLACAAGHACAQQEPDADRERQALRAAMDSAWGSRDHASLSDALDRAFEVDAPAARQWAYDTIIRGSPAQRAVGAGVLAERGRAQDLEAAARGLSATQFRDERRWLVRALAGKPAEEAGPAAMAFLEDRDPGVRLAAAQSLGALKHTPAVGALLTAMREPPALRAQFDDSDAGLLSAAGYGLVHAVADLRPERQADVKRWWASARAAPDRAPGPRHAALLEGPPVEGRFQGRQVLRTPWFDVQLRVGDARWGDGMEWAPFRDMAEEARAESARRWAEEFGAVALPPMRLILADPREFSALTSSAWFGGQASGNQVVLRLDRPEVLRAVMTHEMIHVLHALSFRDQPRWLAEGLAESLSISGSERSVWTRARVQRLGLEDSLAKGVVTEAIGWDAGPSSDRREGPRYAMSHLVVDYLRLGPFARGRERLAFLMGRLSRGENAAQALELLYERTPRELDADVRAWVEGR